MTLVMEPAARYTSRSVQQHSLPRPHTHLMHPCALRALEFDRIVQNGNRGQASSARGRTCPRHGCVWADPIDVPLCAVSERHRLPILTTDDDFQLYAHVIPVVLCDSGPRSGSSAHVEWGSTARTARKPDATPHPQPQMKRAGLLRPFVSAMREELPTR